MDTIHPTAESAGKKRNNRSFIHRHLCPMGVLAHLGRAMGDRPFGRCGALGGRGPIWGDDRVKAESARSWASKVVCPGFSLKGMIEKHSSFGLGDGFCFGQFFK